MPTARFDVSHLPRWRAIGSVLVSPTNPGRYGWFEIDLSAALDQDGGDMIAMRLACDEIETRQPSTRGRPIMFTKIVRCSASA